MLLVRLEDCGEIWLKYISRAAGVYTPRSLSKLKRLMVRFTMEIEKNRGAAPYFTGTPSMAVNQFNRTLGPWPVKSNTRKSHRVLQKRLKRLPTSTFSIRVKRPSVDLMGLDAIAM